ncbi:MAG: hypothetical protein H5U37_06525, partial [Caldisericia bacterium]|nr:hypothetical protein [Caldisericia bacterium]
MTIKILFLTLFIASNLWEIFLNNLNLKYSQKKGKEVPDIFKDTIGENLLNRSMNYLKDKVNLLNIEFLIKTLITIFGIIYLFTLFEKFSINLVYKNDFSNYSFTQSLIFFILLGAFLF